MKRLRWLWHCVGCLFGSHAWDPHDPWCYYCGAPMTDEVPPWHRLCCSIGRHEWSRESPWCYYCGKDMPRVRR